jgi:MFS family permease
VVLPEHVPEVSDQAWYGRKQLLLAGLALFGLASLVGGFAQEPGHLVAARAAQGIGAAALAPAGLLNSSRQLGASLGLGALGTAAHRHTGDTITPETLNNGYARGLTLCAAVLLIAVLIAATSLPRTKGQPARSAA